MAGGYMISEERYKPCAPGCRFRDYGERPGGARVKVCGGSARDYEFSRILWGRHIGVRNPLVGVGCGGGAGMAVGDLRRPEKTGGGWRS